MKCQNSGVLGINQQDKGRKNGQRPKYKVAIAFIRGEGERRGRRSKKYNRGAKSGERGGSREAVGRRTAAAELIDDPVSACF